MYLKKYQLRWLPLPVLILLDHWTITIPKSIDHNFELEQDLEVDNRRLSIIVINSGENTTAGLRRYWGKSYEAV